jgi:tetratricopeptide (TPR) repeat protein
MKLASFLASLLVTLPSVCGFAQNDLFSEAFTEFATSRLWEFEEIPLEWKMEGTLQADLNEGLNNLLEQNLQVAEANLTSVIARDSSIWQAYYYRAAIKKKLRQFPAAEKDIHRALKLHGDFYEGLVELAKILHFQAQTYESERAVSKAIRLDRSRGTAYYLKGDINMSQKDIQGGIHFYKACLEVDKMFHDARIKLALIDVLSTKDVSGALKHLNDVLAYDSLQKSALMFRSILGAEKQKEQSVKDLTNLLLVSPNNLLALYNRGLFSAELGNYERAFKDFHKVIEITSTSDNNFVGQQSWLDKKIDLQNVGAYIVSRLYGMSEDDRIKVRKAYCLILIGEYNKSIAALNELAHPNDDPLAVYLKAVAYEHSGSHSQAFNFYNLAISRDDQIADAYKKRAIYEQELKLWDKSVQDFSAVLKLNPSAFRINKMRGVSYYYLAMFKQSLDDFNVYLKNDSTDKETYGYRAMVYKNTNRPLQAYADFAASENHGAMNLRHIEHLVDSVLQLQDTLQALHNLDIITRNMPYFTEGYVQKFKIHVDRNEWKPVSDNIAHALRNRRTDVHKSKHSYLLTLQGLVYSQNKNNDDALKSLSQAIDFDSKNDFAYLERGRIFLSIGKASKAKGDLETASALGNKQARTMLDEMVNLK